MDSNLKSFLESGRALIGDTKLPRKAPVKNEKVSKAEVMASGMSKAFDEDPHRVFVRRVVSDKPKKKELVEQFQKFITIAEEDA